MDRIARSKKTALFLKGFIINRWCSGQAAEILEIHPRDPTKLTKMFGFPKVFQWFSFILPSMIITLAPLRLADSRGKKVLTAVGAAPAFTILRFLLCFTLFGASLGARR